MNHPPKNCVVVVVSDHGHSYVNKDLLDGHLAIVDNFEHASKLSDQEAANARAISPRAVVRDADEYEFVLHANLAVLSNALKCLPTNLTQRFVA